MSSRRRSWLSVVVPLVMALAVATSAAGVRADSFLTDEEFFPVSEEQLARLDGLSWDTTEQPLAALAEDSDPLFHLRLVTRAYFQWAMEPETEELKYDFINALAEGVPASEADWLPTLDLGYAMMTLDQDLNGLLELEYARQLPTAPIEDGEELAVVQEVDEPSVFLALALCYAQADAFLIGNPWEDVTNLKCEAVLNLERAMDSASRSPDRERYVEAFAKVTEYMALYDGLAAIMEEDAVPSLLGQLAAGGPLGD